MKQSVVGLLIPFLTNCLQSLSKKCILFFTDLTILIVKLQERSSEFINRFDWSFFSLVSGNKKNTNL